MVRRPFSDVLERLRSAGLRPTRQRLSLARLLFEGEDRHVTAEILHRDARAAGIKVSLATIYNNLHQFTSAGLLRELVVNPGVTYFDTNAADHHHMYDEDEGRLIDIKEKNVVLSKLPRLPKGSRLKRIDVIIRIESSAVSER